MDLNKLTEKAQEAIRRRPARSRTTPQHAARARASAERAHRPGGRRRAGRARQGRRGAVRSQTAPRSRPGALRAQPDAAAGVHVGALPESLRSRQARSRAAEGRLRQHRALLAGDGRRAGRSRSWASRATPCSGAAGSARQSAGQLAEPRDHVSVAGEVRPRPDPPGAGGQARPGDRPRRGDSPDDSGPLASHQEQPRVDRRAWRWQDRHRRGAGAAHRARRRARGAQRQAHRRAGSRRARRGRKVPRRIRGAAQGRLEGSHRVRRAGHPVHRRAAYRRRRRRGRRRDGRLQHAQADARARRAALHRRHDARRISQTHRKGRRPRAPLPAGYGRPADRRGHDLDPARPARALRAAPQGAHSGFGAGGRGSPIAPLHCRSLPARQGHRPGRRGRRAAAHGSHQRARRAGRGAPPHHAARDRARRAAQGKRRCLARSAGAYRAGACHAQGAGQRPRDAVEGRARSAELRQHDAGAARRSSVRSSSKRPSAPTGSAPHGCSTRSASWSSSAVRRKSGSASVPRTGARWSKKK